MLLALRHPRLWLVSGWILVILATIASLVPAHDLPKMGGISDKFEHVVGYSVLMTAGLAIWCIPTASLMSVRDVDYEYGGPLLAFAGSVQLLWMLVVLVALPSEKAPAPASKVVDHAPAVRVDGGPATVDTGSVPASARATRVVLPGPVASPDIRD